MLRQLEGSRAVADAVALCRPEVIGAYPISPQTHIVERLSALVDGGELSPGPQVETDEQILDLTSSTALYDMHGVRSRALRTEFDDRDEPCVELGGGEFVI